MGSRSDEEWVKARFAENLIRSRQNAGLSQEATARRSAVNRTQVSLYERAKRIPQLDTVVKLAGGLGVKPEELLRGMEWRPARRREGKFHVPAGDE